MANNKKVYTNVKIEQSVLINIAYLELSEDGGDTYEVIDQITIPANSTPTVTDFDLMPSIDVDNPLIKVRVKVVPQTTTTTSTTSTTSSTTTTTTTEAPSPFKYATEQDALDIHNANVGDMLLTGPNWGNEIRINPTIGNTFTLDPCKKILIKGGNYEFITIIVPGLSGTEECPIIITNYDGQVRTKNFSIIGLSHYKLTGKYDPINLTGDENFKGHAETYANTAGKYGIFVDNQWSSTSNHLISIAGIKIDNIEYQSTNFELEYIESGNGGFSNVIKSDGLTEVMDNVRIHDLYIHDTHGEGIYIGSTQGDPQHSFTNLHFYNNRVLRAGNDGVQFGQLQQGCIIENNVVHGAVNWKSPFAGYQDNSVQLSLRDGGIICRNNVFIAGAEKWLNFFLNKIRNSTPSGFIDIDNNTFLHCRGTLGVYFGQSNPMELDGGVRLTSNYFGKFFYQYDEVWDEPIANNSPNLIRVGMRCNLLIAGNRWDGSDGKLNLYYPEPFAVPYITAIDNIIDEVPDVEFVDYMGFPVGFDYLKVELWSRFVGVYENEDSGWFPVEGSKKYDPIYYNVDDIVTHKSKVYKCLVYNTGFEPEKDANWETYWERIDYNGNDIPTDDVRLVSTSFYNGRGMGLLDNPAYDGPATTTSTTSTSSTTTLAPTTTTTTTLPVTPAFEYKTYAKDNGDNTFTVKWGINQSTLTNNPTVVGIGSSTLQGTGNNAGLGLDDRFADYFSNFGGRFISLAQNGYNSFNWLPRGSNISVDNNKNSTAAKCFNPSFAVIVTATNDVENNTPEEGLANLLTIYNDLRDAGIVTFIEASQPRTNYNTERQIKLIQFKNLIKAYFPAELVIDTIDVLKDPNSAKPADYLPAYAQNDGIHLNDTGVGVLFDLFKSKFESTLVDSEFVSWEIEKSDSPNNAFTLFDTVDGSIVSKVYSRIDAGEYFFRVRGKRSDNSYGNYTIISNKLEQTENIGSEEQTIQISFSPSDASFPPEDWNTFQAGNEGPAIGTIYSNIIDSNYNSTPIEVEVIDKFSGVGSTGGSAGLFPARVTGDYWYIANSNTNNAILRIGNLETNKAYKFEIYSSRSTGEQRYIGFDCNEVYNYCAALKDDGTSNTNKTGTIAPLFPDVDGNLFLYFSGSPIGHLNGLIIHRHGIIPSGQTTTTTSSTSTSTSSTTTTTTTLSAPSAFTININLYNGTNPTSNSQWNNWNLEDANSPVGFNNLKYANGGESNINATITSFNNFFDNGADYGEGIGVPAEVLRTGIFTTESNYNASVATITLTGLNNANRYTFELAASRNNVTGNKTSFQAIGATTVTSSSVTTDKNKNTPIVISEIFPNAGTISLKIRKAAGTYGYANALRIFEIIPEPTTTSTSTSTSSTTTTSTTIPGTTTTTTTLFPTTTTTTTIGGNGNLTKISGWKADSTGQYGWIYTPPGYDNSGNTKYPFIVFLHGQGERNTGSAGADVLIQSGKGVGYYLNEGDTPQGIVIFIPQLPTSAGTWEPAWVEAARSYVINNYNGDVDKFYLTGLSLGGSGTSKYVMTYPDRVAAYLIATGDTQWQRGGNAAATVNGIRQADVPGWFHAGTADGTISVNNGVSALTALNALSPKPLYPFLVNTYWGLGHNNDLWGDKVYNRKNRTDATGTSAFDYIDWFKRFKRNDLIYNANSFVGVAEETFDYNDYLVALRLVNKIDGGVDKTNLLSRLGVIKNVITNQNKLLLLNFGSVNASGSINNVNLTVGSSIGNLIDIDGNATNIGFSVVASRWSPPDVSLGLTHEYFGFSEDIMSRAFRVYSTPNTWRFTGLNGAKKYTVRFFYANKTENTTQRFGATATINGTTKQFLDENVNTNKYVDFENVTPSSGNIDIALESIAANSQGDVFAIILFERNDSTPTSSTTSTSTSSTTTTSTTLAPTTTTTTTGLPTTTTSSTTSSTSSSSTTSTTSTSTSSTTTTTTTLEPSGDIAKFNFNLNAQSVSGWKDVSGSPHSGIVSATDTNTGITVTSINGKWGNFGGSANNANGGTGTNSDFPANVLASYWYNYSNVYPANGACLKISGLVPDSSYQLKMIGSRSSTLGGGIPAGQQRIMEFIASQSASVSHASEQSTIDYAARDSVSTQTFTINSNASGEIYLGVYASRTGNTENGNQFGYINGLIVEKL